MQVPDTVNSRLLVALPKSRKTTTSFVMSVCLSACLFVYPSAWRNSAPTRQIFMKFHISLFLYFQKSAEKIQL